MKAQRIKPTLYDGSVISNQHAFIPVIDDEKTLILEEVSQSKMLAKQNDAISKEKKINTTPINYVELNRLSEDFGKHFLPQQELSTEQAFWLQTSHPNTDQSDISPVKIEAPKELPKEHINSMRENNKKEKVKQEMDEIETINIELEYNLKGQIQEKVFVITALQNELRRLKCKNVLDNATTITNATTIAPGMFKLDLDPLAPRLLKNRDAHIDYLKYTQEQADILRGIVKQAKAKQPLDNALDFACKHAKRIQELLVYVRDTCPNANKPSEKLVVVTPMNKVKKVRFSEPLTSSSNIHKQVESSKTPDSNTPVLPSTGLKSSTSASRSQPTGNKKNDRISQTPSSNMKNKVEVQLRRANLSSNKKNHVKDPICDANVKHTMLNANSELICVKCKQCMFDANHDVCFLDFVNDVNVRSKSKSVKQSQQHNIWKPTSKVFTEVGYKWKPIGKLFTLVGYPDCSLVSELRMLKTYDRKPLSAYEVHKDGLERGIPKLKFKKDHQCSACALGKSKKSSHQPKAEDTNQEKLYLLHMDLCGPMCVENINGKKYILVIVDDYSRFTWVKFLRSKDEAPDAIIKCIKNIQVRLNATVHNIRTTDNGTEFVNQTL
ncbi:retrovirus-related pol polyprotein from transposon TNT 1-94 [Tanacetum coccineum]